MFSKFYFVKDTKHAESERRDVHCHMIRVSGILDTIGYRLSGIHDTTGKQGKVGPTLHLLVGGQRPQAPLIAQ